MSSAKSVPIPKQSRNVMASGQHRVNLRLGAVRRAHQHYAEAHVEGVEELDHLRHEVRLRLQMAPLDARDHHLMQLAFVGVGMSTNGNRSDTMALKSGRSAVRNFGMFESGSARFSKPAITSTDLTARNDHHIITNT